VSHTHALRGGPLTPRAAQAVVGLLALVGVAVAVGAWFLWPSPTTSATAPAVQASIGAGAGTVAGKVVAQQLGPCGGAGAVAGQLDTPPPPTGATDGCSRTTVAIESGPDDGHTTTLVISPGPGSPALRVGDDIRLAKGAGPDGVTTYGFYDYSRGLPMSLLAVAFAVVVVVVARWRGLAALAGLVVPALILGVFVIPALLAGESALPVALVGGAAILFAVIYLAHGVSLRTSAALLGTLAALGLSGVLAQFAVELTRLTGLAEEQNTTLQVYAGQVSIVGL